jgi:hypothetical protein
MRWASHARLVETTRLGALAMVIALGWPLVPAAREVV